MTVLDQSSESSETPLLQVRHVKKYFPIRRGVLQREVAHVHAVDDVTFAVRSGETLGLVGESGCGKSTLGRTLVRLLEPTDGDIIFEGRSISHLGTRKLRPLRSEMQMVFQDPYASLNPRKRVGTIVSDPMRIHNLGSRAEQKRRVGEILETVGLSPEHYNRYPHEFSGGQRQRIGIARALALRPKMIIADESRAVQGLGAAVITPSALSIVMTTFREGAERNKALGIWGALGGGGAAVGVLAGGVLTTYLGWEWIFFINVPVGALAFFLAPRFVRESRAEGRKSLDIAGAVTVTAGLALLVYAVSKAPDHGWSSSWTLARLAIAVVLLLAFVGIESRARDPLMPFHIFRIQTVAGANASGLLLGAVTFANFFLLTLYVQQVLGYSAIRTGITFVVTAGSAVLWAGLAQGLTTRFGVKPVLVLGFLAMIAGNIYYTQVSATGSFASELLPGYLLIGFALPFTFIPISIAALAGVSYDEAGLASGLINTSQQIGGAVGVAVCSSVLFSAASFVSGTSRAFWVLAGISVAALVSAVVLIRKEQIAPEAESERAGSGVAVEEGA